MFWCFVSHYGPPSVTEAQHLVIEGYNCNNLWYHILFLTVLNAKVAIGHTNQNISDSDNFWGSTIPTYYLLYYRSKEKMCFVSANNNASPKEGLQWRKRGSNQCNGSSICGVDIGVCGGGDGEGCCGAEGTAGTEPDQLEGPGSIENDTLHLKRRVGLVSGVALIVGTMIGQYPKSVKNIAILFLLW